MKKILCLLPSTDFDPSEVGIPWEYLTKEGHHITFATPDGRTAAADVRMITGKGLGIFKALLRADSNGLHAYESCSNSKEFMTPISYKAIESSHFDALLLPGGHAKGMREYLDSKHLQQVVEDFFHSNKPIGAICHGTLLAARTIDRKTGRSVLYGRKTTGLNFLQELTAWLLTCLWLGDYYRTYTTFLESEVKSFLKGPKDFIKGPMPFSKDNPKSLSAGFCHQDENYISARWPGDAHIFSVKFIALLANT